MAVAKKSSRSVSPKRKRVSKSVSKRKRVSKSVAKRKVSKRTVSKRKTKSRSSKKKRKSKRKVMKGGAWGKIKTIDFDTFKKKVQETTFSYGNNKVSQILKLTDQIKKGDKLLKKVNSEYMAQATQFLESIRNEKQNLESGPYKDEGPMRLSSVNLPPANECRYVSLGGRKCKTDNFSKTNYCKGHTCNEPRCTNKKSTKVKYCENHTCNATDCNERKLSNGDFCEKNHTCTNANKECQNFKDSNSSCCDECADENPDCEYLDADPLNCANPDCVNNPEDDSDYCRKCVNAGKHKV